MVQVEPQIKRRLTQISFLVLASSSSQNDWRARPTFFLPEKICVQSAFSLRFTSLAVSRRRPGPWAGEAGVATLRGAGVGST